MKYLIIFSILFIGSCTKDNSQTTTEDTKPVLIQVQAEHIDGEIVNSEIVLVR